MKFRGELGSPLILQKSEKGYFMHSPLISKIRCNDPKKRAARVANRNHITYIGTREGVDLTPSDELKEFNSSDDKTYVKYIAERPKSHGLFGNVDVMDINGVANHVADLTAKGKPVFRAIVSLSGADAAELGYTSKRQWELYMNEVVPEVAAEFGITVDKLAWVAAVHMEPTHPHCHYMFWRTDDKVQSNYIHTSVQNRCRELLAGRMFEDERKKIIIQKNAARDAVIEQSKLILNKIPSRLHSADLNNIADNLTSLIQILPTSGRLNYGFMPSETKKAIDAISDIIFNHPDVNKQFHNYVNAAEKISATYSPSQVHQNVNIEKAKKDLYTRSGNIILKTAQKKASQIQMENIPEGTPEIDLPSIQPDKFPDFTEENELFHTDQGAALAWTKKYKKAAKLFYKDGDSAAAIEILQSEKNNVLSWELLAKIYSTEKQDELAAQYYQKAFHGFERLYATNEKMHDYITYKLGRYHEFGLGTEVNYEKAIELYSSTDNKFAQYSLGSMYLHEKGIELTKENRNSYMNRIMKLFKSSADQEFGYAAYAYAKLCDNEGLGEGDQDQYYTQALDSFLAQLEKNPNDNLLYRLGTMYYDGLGTQKNKSLAIDYFTKATKYDNNNAFFALGKIYADPKEDLYDPAKAADFFKKASELGNQYASCSLGELYLDSASSLFCPEKGLEILNSLANENNSNALFALGRYYVDIKNPDSNILLGKEYLEKSITHGNIRAQLLLGKTYLSGILGSYQEGFDLLSPLAQEGNTFAQYELAKLHANRELQFFNPLLAEKYFTDAANHGNTFAQYGLAKLYLDRESPIYNPTKALSYLIPLAESGNAIAQAQLGTLYLWGSHEGISKDINLAKYWIDLAIEQGNEYAKESWDFYKNKMYSNSVIKCSYHLFRSIFTEIETDVYRKKQRLEDLKFFASHSKENRRAEQHKRQI